MNPNDMAHDGHMVYKFLEILSNHEQFESNFNSHFIRRIQNSRSNFI